MVDIQSLKEQFGPLFKVTVGGTDFIFKQLSIGEFSEIGDMDLTPDVADTILQNGVVYPEEYQLRLGELLGLSEAILKTSGWSDPDIFLDVLDDKRKTTNLMFPQAKSALCTVFNMKPREVDELQIEEFAELVSQAESAMGQRLFKSKRRNKESNEHGPIPEMRPVPEDGKWAASPGDLQSAGIAPAFNSLIERIEDETGNTPLTYNEAKKLKRRPSENLPKAELNKEVQWVDDLRKYQKPEEWPDGK